MTEQEAQAFAERLRRIWVPLEIGMSGRHRHRIVKCRLNKGYLNFTSPITAHVNLEMFPLSDTYFLALRRQEEHTVTGHFSCVRSTGLFQNDALKPPDRIAQFTQFVEEWLPYFRRGCWLSGFPIDASAHEKAEWMQGFNREEIEAWNLKM